MPNYYTRPSKKHCSFCDKNSKLRLSHVGYWFCPNGHSLVRPNGETITLQPISGETTFINNPKRIYRKTNSAGAIHGVLCNVNGVSR